MRQLSKEEMEVVVRFAKAHGRRWKSELSQVYWYNARVWRGGEENDGYILHSLRNDPNWGVEGLTKFKLPS